MKNEILCMILDLKGKGSVTYQTSVQFIEILTTIVDSIVDSFNYSVKSSLSSLKNLMEIPAKIEQLNALLNHLKKVPRSFNSEYKIREYYHSHPLFVAPEPLVMNQSYETSPNGKAVLKYNSAQYLSIKKIQDKLKVPGVFDLWFPQTPLTTNDEQVFASFYDGKRYQKLNAEKNPAEKHVIYFQL